MAPRSAQGERRAIGLFSLTIGAVLLVLILARGQQAAREGNQELRNDTYWVLVSPLVFSGFGLYLLRTPAKGARRPTGTIPPPPAVERSVSTARREAERSVQAITNTSAQAEQRLVELQQALTTAQARITASDQQLQLASTQAETRIQQLESQLAELRQKRSSSEHQLATAAAAGDERLAQAREQLARAEAAAREGEQRLNQSAAAAQARIAALEQQLDGMRQARDRAEADLQSLMEGSSTAASVSVEQTTALRQQLQTVSEALEQRLEQARLAQTQALSEQRSDLDRLQEQLLLAAAEAAAAREQACNTARAAEERLEAMGSQLEALQQERHQLHGTLERIRNEGATRAEQALAAATGARSELGEVLAQLSSRNSELQTGLHRFIEQEQGRLTEARQAFHAALQQLEQTQSQEKAASTEAGQRLVELDQQIQQAQQSGLRSSRDVAAAIHNLEQTRNDLEQTLQTSRQSIASLGEQLNAQMARAREDADRALELSREAQAQLEGFQLSRNDAAMVMSSSAGEHLPKVYCEACEEIGVVPGSDWAVVRATWRRNIKLWHPDQGGNPERWMRRNAAYQLLTAWYDFNGPA